VKKFYITKNEDLIHLANLIEQEKLIAVDTEFVRRTTYYPILSLVQISIPNIKESFVIDCLTNLDLEPIYKIISDEKITKIFYSSWQDLQIFYHQSNLFPSNIVDLQVMANFCNFGFNIGYANLAEELLGIKIDKKFQNSDWTLRPLDVRQVEYAFLDVFHLNEVYKKLLEILQEKKRTSWFYEEMEFFTNRLFIRSDDALLKNFSSRFKDKTRLERAKIKDLILWREKISQQINVPRQHFLEDYEIEKMVMLCDFNVNLSEKYKTEIKIILENTDENDVLEERKNFVMNETQKDIYKKTKRIISSIAKQESFKEQFLITQIALKSAILGHKQLVECISSWRYELFGAKVEKQIIN
jgi:ribonuclease D